MEKEEKKKPRRNHKRRLFLLILLLLVTTVLLGTSSYAWFTSNKNVTVNPITVNVAATGGIQVSVDAINWKSIIATTDLEGADATYADVVNQIPSGTNNPLEPVSTVGAITNDKINMFYGQVDTSVTPYLLTAEALDPTAEADGNSGKYVAFDLFLRVDSEDNTATQVYLKSEGSTVVASGGSTGIENAARVGFVNLGTMASGTDAAILQTLGTDSTSTILGGGDYDYSASLVLWEPNNDVHTATGVDNASSVYGINSLTAGAGNAPVAYNGIKAAITTANSIQLNSANTTYFDPVTPGISTATGYTNNEELFLLDEGVTKLRIYMWVEGQDVDCENSASGGSIAYNLQFTTESGVQQGDGGE